MHSPNLVRTAIRLIDAALDPSAWPAVLESLAETAGAIGACCLVQNKLSGQVEWISFAGPCAELLAHDSATGPIIRFNDR
jgi:hypothetical protein